MPEDHLPVLDLDAQLELARELGDAGDQLERRGLAERLRAHERAGRALPAELGVVEEAGALEAARQLAQRGRVAVLGPIGHEEDEIAGRRAGNGTDPV